MRLRLRGPRPQAAKLIAAFADAYPDAFFVEIGANDGHQHDHLQPYILKRGWAGIMVEPVPYVFDRLRVNYGHVDGVLLENAAVGATDGVMPFYHLVDADQRERDRLPDWYDGIGSFSRQQLLDHARDIPDVADRIVTSEVLVVTFQALCERHGASSVDLLAIDAEGHDATILRSIDFAQRCPALVIYEHYHLPPDERSACASHLRAVGYETVEEGFDTFCVHATAAPGLRRAWRRFRPGVAGVARSDEPA